MFDCLWTYTPVADSHVNIYNYMQLSFCCYYLFIIYNLIFHVETSSQQQLKQFTFGNYHFQFIINFISILFDEYGILNNTIHKYSALQQNGMHNFPISMGTNHSFIIIFNYMWNYSVAMAISKKSFVSMIKLLSVTHDIKSKLIWQTTFLQNKGIISFIFW